MQEQVELTISGMTCDGCAAHVRRALEGVPGVWNVVVPDWREGRASVVTDASLADEVLTEAVAAAGYEARVSSRHTLAEETEPVRPGEAEVDLMIVGSGSAGFAAAIRAAELGYSALMKRLVDRLIGISPEGGAQTSIHLATSPDLEGVTGQYFVRQQAVPSSEVTYDEAIARRLWQVSAELTGLPATG